jgi:shikimate kinase
MNLFLFGWKRMGKTYYGKKTSQKYGISFLDTDEQVAQLFEKKEGKNLTCLDIVLLKGELFFRELEKEVIFSLRKEDNSIIALGGGSLLDKENYFLLQSLGKFVYLTASEETIRKRLFTEPLPYYLQGSDKELKFQNLYLERKKIYEEISAVSIRVDLQNEEEILERLFYLYSQLQ